MKYMGSKARIAKHILPIMLKNRVEGQWWVEPFVGGANIIDKVEGNRIGADFNRYLIAFLKALQQGWDAPAGIDKEMYDSINKNKDSYPDELVGCIGFCFTYSAKWFGGFIGNTKDIVCKGRDRIGESYRAIEKARKQVSGIDLRSVGYFDLEIPAGSIIYCDPPYENTTGYKDKFDHCSFWAWVRVKSSQGHQVFISEYNAPADFVCVWQKEIESGLNKAGAKKGVEKLFVHESQVESDYESLY